MPEGGTHAPILIATSWQALNRAIRGHQGTLRCDCTVVILFAGFYVEASLNYIIEQIHMTQQMQTFLEKKYPGLQDKLSWFYNEFIARPKAPNRERLRKQGIQKKLRRRFPGFAKLYRFRNDISHGHVNKIARSLEETKTLRQQAKDIVEELFIIMQKHGYNIPRDTTYKQALTSENQRCPVQF